MLEAGWVPFSELVACSGLSRQGLYYSADRRGWSVAWWGNVKYARISDVMETWRGLPAEAALVSRLAVLRHLRDP